MSRGTPSVASERRWILPSAPSEEGVARLASSLDLPPTLCRLLLHRDLADPDRVRRYLRPRFEHLHDPMELPDVELAVERVERAVAGNETVLVHGDFDADGMCAAALLTRGLRELGGRVEPFVPHRTREGYDLGDAGLARAAEVDASLILTADCGVSAVGPVRRAGEAGRDVVITDHHRPPDPLPSALAVVNPTRSDSAYPFRGLAGVGVAFKLLSLLYRRAGRGEGEVNRHLDLVAIGTVADVVPLVDENRALVRAGLRALGRTDKPGLRALLRAADLTGRDLAAADIAYRIAPRLNAVGRVKAAETGLRLLLSEDPDEASDLAAELESSNRERRRRDRRVEREAEELLERRFDPERDRSVVLWREGWHPGVIGIVASRVARLVHRPTVLVSLEEEEGRGSGRSIEGFHLHRALEECAPLLERYGGHSMAGGLEIARENLEPFAERLEEIARRELDAARLTPTLKVDLVLPLDSAGSELMGLLEHMEPFGAENPRPVLMTPGVRIESPSAVGDDGRHLRAALAEEGDGRRLEAIGFGMGHRLGGLRKNERYDVAFELTVNRYRGRERLQARLRDFRPATGGGTDG